MELTEGCVIPTGLFVRAFRPHFRVRFAWDRLERERWPVRMGVVDSPRDLEGWFVPWYLRGGEESGFGDRWANSIGLTDVPQLLGSLRPSRRDRIAALAASFTGSREPVQLAVATYWLGSGRHLVLDGNHRLAALLLAVHPFTLIVFTVFGPLDSGVLPDIQHWLPSEVSYHDEHT
ncbi:MAG: hypothetical protein ACHRXM_31260 [Isosphaerales bacterium]